MRWKKPGADIMRLGSTAERCAGPGPLLVKPFRERNGGQQPAGTYLRSLPRSLGGTRPCPAPHAALLRL